MASDVVVAFVPVALVNVNLFNVDEAPAVKLVPWTVRFETKISPVTVEPEFTLRPPALIFTTPPKVAGPPVVKVFERDTAPLPSIVSAETVEVAKVDGDEVAKYRFPPAFLKVQLSSVLVADKVSCGAVEVARCNR